MLALSDLTQDFASALACVDMVAAAGGLGPWRDRHRGVGALSEQDTLVAVTAQLRRTDRRYLNAGRRPYPNSHLTCDLVIPGRWAVEVRRVRAFGDDGSMIENWSTGLLHPYAGPETAVGDCYRLADSRMPERRAFLLFGYEHIPAEVSLLRAAEAFEAVVRHVTTVPIGVLLTAETGLLVHPVHQRGVVFAWEITTPLP